MIDKILKTIHYTVEQKENDIINEILQYVFQQCGNIIKDMTYTTNVGFDSRFDLTHLGYDRPYTFQKLKIYQKIFKDKVAIIPYPESRLRKNTKTKSSETGIKLSDISDNSLLYDNFRGATIKHGTYIQRLDSYTVMVLQSTGHTSEKSNTDGDRIMYIDNFVTEYIIGRNHKKWAKKISMMEEKYSKKYLKLSQKKRYSK